MKINIKHTEKVEEALAEVNGRAESFAVTTASSVQDVADRAEKMLSALPASRRAGARVLFRPAGPSAARYKFAATTTVVGMTRTSTGWFMTTAYRGVVFPKQAETLDIQITEAQRDEIAERAVSGFSVHRKEQAA